jgi:serine/threonine protein kinase
MQQILETIGKGGFGVVYKAINIESGETVAIKQIPLDNIPKEQLSSVMVRYCLLLLRSTSDMSGCRWKLSYCESLTIPTLCDT